MKKDFLFEGIEMKAEVEFITEKDMFKNPTRYEFAEEGDVKAIYINDITIYAVEEDPVGALITLKEDIEKLIDKIRKIENENN